MFASRIARPAGARPAPGKDCRSCEIPSPMARRASGLAWDLTQVPAFDRSRHAHDDAGKSEAADHAGGCGCGACAARALDTKDGPAPAGPAAGAGPAVPAAGPAIRRTVSVYSVALPGSSRSPDPDVARANAVWNQCGVAVSSAGGESWTTNVLDQLAPAGVLNEFSSPSSPTAEETTMLAHQPGGSAIHVYHVPSMSAGSRGEAFIPSITPALPAAVVVSDSAASDTLAHELGHILLNDGGHHADADNLMASGSIRNVGVDKLDTAQCGRV